jgi:hypothetical protein
MGANGQRYAEHIEGIDPVESGFSSFLDETGHRVPQQLPSPELAGPGVMYRSMKAAPGAGAPAQMIAPAEIAKRGLSGARSAVADRALAGDALGELGDMEQRFLQQRTVPMSLQQAQRMKRAEQDLAEAAYAARRSGGPVNSSQQQFHEGIARGAREAIEHRAPEVIPMNKRSQELIGLNRALEDASFRNVPGVGLVRTMLGNFAPGMASGAAIGIDRASKVPFNAALKTALIAALGGAQE